MIELLKKLISCESITPEDAGCQSILISELQSLGFHIETLPFGNVKNVWARYGTKQPLFVFAGHTDVVPPGPLSQWKYPPFSPTIENEILYGRGAADMKGAIAAMLNACKQFLKMKKEFDGSIGFLITGNEEGATNTEGTIKVVEHLQQRREHIDYCIVGEASSKDKIGDSIKMGRRGSLSGFLTIYGKQGHIAYPEKANNPIALALPALNTLAITRWDEGNAYFPPTSFQFAHIHAGTGTMNMIPENIEINFNFRYSPESTAEELQEKVETILKSHHLNYGLRWSHSAKPFMTQPRYFTNLVSQCIQEKQKFKPEFATDGGTSDARFIAPTGAEVIELGACRESIHQVNEHIKIEDLHILSTLYFRILNTLFG